MALKNKQNILCVDIGGTTIKSAVVQDNHLYDFQKNSTPKNYSSFIKLITQLKTKSFKKFDIKGVAISTPGIINKIKTKIDGVSAINYIHKKNFLCNLQKKINLPISVENDANCVGIAEITQKQFENYKNVVVIVIGTGIGGCIFIDRKILKGSNGFAGEFGLMNYGSKKNWGWYASPVAQFNIYNKKENTQLTGIEIFKKGIIKNQIKLDVIQDLIDSWALGIYNIATILNPEIFIISGGISKNKNLSNLIKKQTTKYIKNIQNFEIKITNAKFANNANLIGAYWVYCNVENINKKTIGFLKDDLKF